MYLSKIVANFDAADRLSRFHTPYDPSGFVIDVNIGQTARLVLSDNGRCLEGFVDLTVRTGFCEMTRSGPALCWSLVCNKSQVGEGRMAITMQEHVSGKATLYLERPGQPDLPVARLIKFDEESGVHTVELSRHAIEEDRLRAKVDSTSRRSAQQQALSSPEASRTGNIWF